MEPEDTLLRSQEAATGPYPEPDKSTPHPYTLSFYDKKIFYSHKQKQMKTAISK
jgi:hypothetical protein